MQSKFPFKKKILFQIRTKYARYEFMACDDVKEGKELK